LQDALDPALDQLGSLSDMGGLMTISTMVFSSLALYGLIACTKFNFSENCNSI
jgi:hypothetical protein